MTENENMMLLSYLDLINLVETGVINAAPTRIQGSSIDVTLDSFIRVEDEPKFNAVVDLRRGENIETRELRMDHEFGYQIVPGEFVLASTAETLSMPNYLSAEFRLKSSVARNGLEHLNACWIDPGFTGKLTLELINVTKKHRLTIKPCMPIGQIVFMMHGEVPTHASYRARGQYNGQDRVTASKGVR
jgi:dCTP deaminase